MDIHKVIGYLPHPKKGWVLPSHKYTGPYNPLDEQLSNDIPVSGQEPFNNVDEISLRHDICYRDKPSEKKQCDKIMLNELKLLQPKNNREGQIYSFKRNRRKEQTRTGYKMDK